MSRYPQGDDPIARCSVGAAQAVSIRRSLARQRYQRFLGCAARRARQARRPDARRHVPAALTAHQRREALERRDRGEAVREIARSYSVSHSTISRLSA